MTWGASGLTVRFGSIVALDDVDIAVAPGDITAVVGGDGAGKTTLLRVLAGIGLPHDGTVRLPQPGRIGYVPPQGGVFADLSVDENLEFVAGAYRIDAWQDRARDLPRDPAGVDGGSLGRREQEQSRLDALAQDGRERQRGEREAAGDQGGVDLLLEVGLDTSALPAHPEDHPGEHADGRERHEALEDLLSRALELGTDGEDHGADHRGEPDRERRAPPDDVGPVRATELLQVGQQDRDDEGGFDALAQRDDERGSHLHVPPASPTALARSGS